VNAEWGNLRAILAGDYLLGRASEIAADLGTEVAGLLATTITQLCQGQILELESAYDVDRTEARYEQSINGKTAALLATACRIGAIVGDLPRPTVESLTEFGVAYGMAFQVVDDILDVVASDEQLGKPAGNDMIEGVYSLPVIHTLRSSVGAELRPLLSEAMSEADRLAAIEIVRNGPGVAAAHDVAMGFVGQAKDVIATVSDNEVAHALAAACDHLLDSAKAATL